MGILVTTALPNDLPSFGRRDGVWVTEPRVPVALATALRGALVELAATRRAVACKNEAMDVVFAYLTGPEFRQRIEAFVRTFRAMQADLEEEKRAAHRRFARREKQLARLIEGTCGLYGDLEGLLGSSMPPVAALEEGDEVQAALSEGASGDHPDRGETPRVFEQWSC